MDEEKNVANDDDDDYEDDYEEALGYIYHKFSHSTNKSRNSVKVSQRH